MEAQIGQRYTELDDKKRHARKRRNEFKPAEQRQASGQGRDHQHRDPRVIDPGTEGKGIWSRLISCHHRQDPGSAELGRFIGRRRREQGS